MKNGSRLKGLLYLCATTAMFGLGVVLAKILGGIFNPFFITFLSLFTGGILVAGYTTLRRQTLLPKLSKSAWLNVLLLATFGTALPLILVLTGLSSTSAIVAGILLQAQGPTTVVLAALVLKERLTWQQAAGTVLILLGGCIIVLQGKEGFTWESSGLGTLLVLLGACGYGFALIPAKRLTGEATTLQISSLRLLLGASLVLPLLLFQTSLITGAITWETTWIFIVYVITSYCLAYLFQQAGLGLLKAWEAAAIIQTVPLFSALFAALFLNETLTPIQFIGAALVLLGGLIIALGEARERTNLKDLAL